MNEIISLAHILNQCKTELMKYIFKSTYIMNIHGYLNGLLNCSRTENNNRSDAVIGWHYITLCMQN